MTTRYAMDAESVYFAIKAACGITGILTSFVESAILALNRYPNLPPRRAAFVHPGGPPSMETCRRLEDRGLVVVNMEPYDGSTPPYTTGSDWHVTVAITGCMRRDA